MMRSPSLKGPGVLQRTPSSVSGGFRPKKTPDTAQTPPSSLARTGSAVLGPRQENSLKRAPSSGGFRPRPELLAGAQEAAKDVQGITSPPTAQTLPNRAGLTRTASGLSGPGTLQKSPSSSSGGFRPRKVGEEMPVSAPPPEAKKRASQLHRAAEYDPISEYMRDAKWFSRSFDADEKKLEVKTQVQKLLRGTSSKLTREILEEDDESTSAPPAMAKRQSTTSAAGGALSDQRLAAVLARSVKADEKLTALAAALEASERRHSQAVDQMGRMAEQMGELAAAVRVLAGQEEWRPRIAVSGGNGDGRPHAAGVDDAETDQNVVVGMVKGLAGMFAGQGRR